MFVKLLSECGGYSPGSVLSLRDELGAALCIAGQAMGIDAPGPAIMQERPASFDDHNVFTPDKALAPDAGNGKEG